MPTRWVPPFLSKLTSRRAMAGAVLAASLAAGPVHAETNESMAARLAALRAEVEGLSETLSNAKSDSHARLQALARQEADLRLELDREEVRIAKLRSILNEKRDTISERSERGEDLAPILDSSVAALKAYINSGLPFRRVERLKELDNIVDQRRSGALSYGKALVRVWSFIEDEIRMTRESGSFQQTIELDSGDTLAQVIRVGMVSMFFQTRSGETGYAQRRDGSWVFTESNGSTEDEQITRLFESFKKQIRMGLFHLPNVLPTPSSTTVGGK